MSIMSLTTDEITEITLYINTYRAKNQAPPLVWNQTLADFSQQWSNHLLTDNLFEHSHTPLYGENLAYFQGYGTDKMTLLKKSVDNWYNEISLYDFKNPGYSDATGHFTCLVWLTSTDYGIALDIDPTTTKTIITMNTFPPGNVIGQFEANVLPFVPAPVPVLVPIPIPSPIPVPSPSTKIIIQAQNIIGMIYNIIHAIQSKKPKFYILYQIRTAINYVIATNIPISTKIVYMLQSVLNMVQTKSSMSLITGTLLNIITMLQPYTIGTVGSSRSSPKKRGQLTSFSDIIKFL